MRADSLDKLVAAGQLKGYTFDCRDDTGKDPYLRFELEFPNGMKIVFIPEGKSLEGVERVGLYEVR